ncbi:MAG: hypothetical protein GYA51_14075 [Candidatus Methanofastidiosa archaeon]|nr:hypothetical protein [Candidatus Methanofastidiosa archaeon]
MTNDDILELDDEKQEQSALKGGDDLYSDSSKSSEELRAKEKELKELLKKVQEELGMSDEDWKSEQGIQKRKEVADKVLNTANDVLKTAGASLVSRKKAKRMQQLLNVGTIASLVAGVWGFIQNTYVVKADFMDKVLHGASNEWHWGGMLFLKIAIILFVLRVIHKILSKGGIFLNDLTGLWKDSKDKVKKKKDKANESFVSFDEYDEGQVFEQFELVFELKN